MLRVVSQRRSGLGQVYKCHPGEMRLRVSALMLCSLVTPLELQVRVQQMARRLSGTEVLRRQSMRFRLRVL